MHACKLKRVDTHTQMQGVVCLFTVWSVAIKDIAIYSLKCM